MGRWVWAAAIVVAIGTFWYQWRDDALQPEAKRWIEQGSTASAHGSQAFAFLMGFDAPVGKDPSFVGKDRLNRAFSAIKKQATETASTRLNLPGGDEYCRIRQSGCLERILSKGISLQSQLDRHAEVLSRYSNFLLFEEFSSMVAVRSEALVPPVSYLSTGNKLMQFAVIVDTKSGHREQATKQLDDTIAHLRRHLSYADTLMQKVFIGSLIADNLDFAAGLYSQGLIHPLSALAPLAPEEITLETAIRREFATHVNRFSEIAEHGLPDSESRKPPSQFIFKKNRSINTLFTELRQLMVRSSLPAALVDDAFVAHRKKQKKDELYSLSNPVGSIVVKTLVNLEPVVFRLRDLDCKLKLVSIRMQVPPGNAQDLLVNLPDSIDLSNPYEPDELVALDSDSNTLCFDGPENQSPAARCIVL